MTWVVAIARGLGRMVAVTVGVAALAWLLVEAAPGTAPERAARAAGVLPPADRSLPPELRRELLADVAERHELDRALAIRVGDYVLGVAGMDFGRSWVDGAPVRPRLASAAGASLVLILLALGVSLASGTAAAAVSASRPGGIADHALAVAAAVAVSLPPVWLAMIALRVFALGRPWELVPPSGLGSVSAALLPVAVLASVPAFVVARHGRAALRDAARAPWALAALARGVSRRRLVWVHALRVSASSLLPLVVVLVGYLLGAVMVVERVFGIRGMGELLVTASGRGDAPVVVGVSVVAAAVLAATSVVVDLGRALLDPKAREAHRAA